MFGNLLEFYFLTIGLGLLASGVVLLSNNRPFILIVLGFVFLLAGEILFIKHYVEKEGRCQGIIFTKDNKEFGYILSNPN